jgi:hypothetical protein
MHGFSNGASFLKELCLGNDVIFVQEHWLLTAHLTKLNDISSDFIFYGVSAMGDACAQGIVRGRPYGGVGVLVRKTYSKFISLCGYHQDSRAVAIKFDYNDLHIICVGAYFPYDKSSHDYSACICSITGFIESLVSDNPGYKTICTGDYNFECNVNDKGYRIFSQLTNELELEACDLMNTADINYTYHHETLGHKSFIDHFFVHKDLFQLVSEFKIIENGANLSDHLPISVKIILHPHTLSACGHDNNASNSVSGIREFRWDKGNRAGYYLQTGSMLDSIDHDFPCLANDNNCSSKHCHLDIDIYCNEIVHCLMNAAKCHIPQIPANALKHYWSDALNELKNDSIFAHEIWKSAGRPQSGAVFELKKNAKYKYKLAIRDAANQFEDKFNDELLETYMNKDFNNFWHCWKKKTCKKSPRASSVEGLTNDIDIANRFAEHFAAVSDGCAPSLATSIIDVGLYETRNWMFSVEEVDYVIRNCLKTGKAAGHDNISAEHILWAHPSVVLHLCKLFNLILQHGYVPANFGSGIIIPLVKDRLGDVSKIDNYRAITVGSFFSKIFELCVSSKFGNFLNSNDLQFGFKKGIGCANAVYAVQQVVEHFNNRGSIVFVSSLDASKAFDRVNHDILINKLVDRNVPYCLINVLQNWYNKLTATVRWNGRFSHKFAIYCGVRQGSVLSPLLFNIYVDDLITRLSTSGLGCYIGNIFFGCVMYADDLLLLSASVSGLQSMLDVCFKYGQDHVIIFNPKKSICCHFGSSSINVTAMTIGGLTVDWVNSFKYLGVTFNNNGTKINIDCHVVKRKFYSACNSVLSHCKRNNELVKLHLVKSFCLPLLTYCLGAIEIPRYRVKQIGVCWNDSFRKIFGSNRWESVKELQFNLGELPFEYLYDLYCLKFLSNRNNISDSFALLLDLSNLQFGHLNRLLEVYCNNNCLNFKHSVHEVFRCTLI